MADQICKLIEQPLLRKRFSDATVLDMNKFDRGEIIRQWENLLNQLS